MKKIDFENFKVIFDNVRINGFRQFLSALIRPLFSYNLKKPHRNSLEGVRERLKTFMLQTKMIALYSSFSEKNSFSCFVNARNRFPAYSYPYRRSFPKKKG